MLFVTAALVRADEGPDSPTPNGPPPPPEINSEPGLFTFEAPEGWKVVPADGMTYKVCVDGAQDESTSTARITVEKDDRPAAESLTDYITWSFDQMKKGDGISNLKISSPIPFKTNSGLTGFRVTVSETLNKFDLQQITYFFDGVKPGTKIVVTCMSLARHAEQLAPVFDASMLTFDNK